MDIKAVENRIVIKVDMQGKNSHTFANGIKIVLERDWNNLDRKHTQITQGEVVDGAGLPEKSIVLFHHNSTHAVNELFNAKQTSGSDIASEIKYFSIPEAMCYAYHDGEDWKPMPFFEFALRVFEPIKTQFYGIAPKLLKETLFITTGEFKNKVVHTLKACDYTLIFNDFNGQEKQIVRCRHFPENKKIPNIREEIIGINDELTSEVEKGNVYVGLNKFDAKPLKEYYDSLRPSQIIA